MTTRGGIGAHQSAKAETVEWITPRAVIDALGGADSFSLDPCAALAQPWPCARASYTMADDGLVRPWHGAVYCNPPYGAALGTWLGKLADHGTGTALIFARTETDDFFAQTWSRASAVLFLRGRLHFHYGELFTDKAGRRHQIGERARHNGGAPSVLIAYGASEADRLARCGLKGYFFELKHGRLL